MKSTFKKALKLFGAAILIATPIVLLSYYIAIKAGIDKLNSKVILFNALYFASFGWWFALMNRASELRKYEAVLSAISIETLTEVIKKTVDVIWGILHFTLAAIITSFLALFFEDSLVYINFNFLSIYFFISVCALLFLSKTIKSRIENAMVLLEKKMSDEKRKEELIKSLKADASKFEPDEQFESYNTVINSKNKN